MTILKNRNEPMSPTEFHKLIEMLDLSVYASGDVLGVSLRSAQRYASGELQVPEPVARLLRVLAAIERAGLRKRVNAALDFNLKGHQK